MIRYLAGGEPKWREHLEGHHLLVSFAESRQLDIIDLPWDIPGLLLDSGAYTQLNPGSKRVIDTTCLGEYADFVASNRDALTGYFTLDILPQWDTPEGPSQREVDRSATQSWKNWNDLRDWGLNPIPVFHYGEPWEYLDFYVVSDDVPLIGLGAGNLRRSKKFTNWLFEVFQRHPRQAFHGLGIGSETILSQFPFYSVDNTTWLQLNIHGAGYLPRVLKNKGLDFYEALGLRGPTDWRLWTTPLDADGRRLYREAGIQHLMSLRVAPQGRMPGPETGLRLCKTNPIYRQELSWDWWTFAPEDADEQDPYWYERIQGTPADPVYW